MQFVRIQWTRRQLRYHHECVSGTQWFVALQTVAMFDVALFHNAVAMQAHQCWDQYNAFLSGIIGVLHFVMQYLAAFYWTVLHSFELHCIECILLDHTTSVWIVLQLKWFGEIQCISLNHTWIILVLHYTLLCSRVRSTARCVSRALVSQSDTFWLHNVPRPEGCALQITQQNILHIFLHWLHTIRQRLRDAHCTTEPRAYCTRVHAFATCAK